MTTRFHQGALRRLSLTYEQDPRALRDIEERARHLGTPLPASFVEWYGMRDGVELLGRNSNDDHPVAIARLGAPCEKIWEETRDLIREGLLLFMVENQGVNVWAVRLDAGDDPPVVVAHDPDFEWRPCAERFTTFIESQVWDHTEIFASTRRRILLQAQDVPLEDGDLVFLRERFGERAATHGWPGENQYRFERGDARLLIWDGEDQADWFLAAGSEKELESVTREVWGCGDLRFSLWSNEERGERVLRVVREGGRTGGALTEGPYR